MIYTVGATKGGVGKTTLALQLALSWIRKGRKVLVIDGDRQASLLRAAIQRSETDRRPRMICAHYPDEGAMRGQIAAQRHHYDDIVIDVGGHDSAALRMALVLSDMLIVPVVPRSVDVWGLDDMLTLIDRAQEVRVERGWKPLICLATINQADPRGRDNGDAQVAVQDMPQLSLIDAPIGRRKAYADALGLGLSVEEMARRDDRACRELMQWLRKVNTIAMRSIREQQKEGT